MHLLTSCCNWNRAAGLGWAGVHRLSLDVVDRVDVRSVCNLQHPKSPRGAREPWSVVRML